MTKLRHESPPTDVWRIKYTSKQNEIGARLKRLAKQKAVLVRAFVDQADVPDADREILLSMSRYYAKAVRPTSDQKAVAKKYRAAGLDLRSNHQSAMNQLRGLLPGRRKKPRKTGS